MNFARTTCLAVVALAAAPISQPLRAQSGKIFDKTYPVTSRPDLQIVVENAAVHAQSCGSCREIHIHVDVGDLNLSDFRLQESQSGNLVRFSLKRPDNRGWSIGGPRRHPEVTVSLPSEANVKLESDNGAMTLAGVSGNIDMRSDNGAQTLSESRGSIRMSTDNGRITVEHVEGALSARTDNGGIGGTGRFTQLDARTDNGSVRLTALEGSSLASGVHVTTDNGAVELRLPCALRADVDLRSDGGGIHCNLPLKGEDSRDDRHRLHGSLNGGGGNLLRVTTGNGSITLDGL